MESSHLPVEALPIFFAGYTAIVRLSPSADGSRAKRPRAIANLFTH